MRKQASQNSERGMALMVALFALVLVSAVGLALMFSMNGETAIDAGYRQSNLAYFAARSGLEEVRDRIRSTTAPNGLNGLLPTVPIGQANGVVYIVNNANENVQPWNTADPYFDDELCHEINSPLVPNSPGNVNTPCPKNPGSLPALAGWYTQPVPTAEALPGNVNLSYKWTRINLKLNETTTPWCVLGANCNHLLPGGARADQVCYNGKNEFVLADMNTPLEVPGLVERGTLPSELAMAMMMFEGGSTGKGNSSHASATTTSGSSSTTSGTGTAGSSSSSGSGSASGTSTGSSSSSSSTSGSSSSSTTGLVGSSSSTTGIAGTGSSTTGIAGTGSSTTGIAGTGSSTTGIAGTGSSSSSSSTGSASSSSSSSSGGQQAPSCGTNAPPLPGTPVGVGAGPVNAPSCRAVDSEPVYVVTSLAVAPNSVAPNKARRMLQYEVARIAMPPVPSALTLIGPNPNVTGLPNSNNFFINGNDTSACAGPPVPAVGTLTDVGNGAQTATDVATDARNTFINNVPAGRNDHYIGADACAANQPDVQNVQNTTNSLYSTPVGLNGIVQDVSNAATQTYSGNTTDPPNLGTDAAPKVTVIDGDLTLSGSTSGAGILLVTGAITFKGNFTFHGVLLVIGAGVLQASGGGSGDFHGAVVIANIGNNTGCAAGKDPCYTLHPTEQNLLANLGSPTMGWNGGGGNGVYYDSCNINLGLQTASYTVIARREITY
ncbi:MAG TPA: pilus assembly PilX N-terminal domain-containing protein [Terriglobales bacterium]|nr:pilus assembly PilX N-terminal domain-containing protein [Terriglobales bacterium]